jgi:CRP-like cAMP-binding protein
MEPAQKGLFSPMSELEPISMADACHVLAHKGWLATRPADFREALLAAGHLRTFAAGDPISTAGDGADVGPGLYGFAAGQVAVLPALGAPDAPTAVLFNPGQWYGYAPLFGVTRQIHVHATTATTILNISFSEVHRMLKARPDWWKDLAELVFATALVATNVLTDLLLSRSDRRLAAMLLHHAGCRHTGQALPIHLNQEDVGATARLSRHPARQLLQSFEARGWISQSYRCIHILAPEQLRTLVDSGEPHSRF